MSSKLVHINSAKGQRILRFLQKELALPACLTSLSVHLSKDEPIEYDCSGYALGSQEASDEEGDSE